MLFVPEVIIPEIPAGTVAVQLNVTPAVLELKLTARLLSPEHIV